MAAELVTLFVAGALVLLLVAMYRYRDGVTPARRSRGGSAVWNSALIRPKTARLSPRPVNPMPERDPSAAGRDVMEHLRHLEERSPGLAAQVIPIFLKDTAQRLVALKEAVLQRDGTAAHRLAHTLHGSAASVGAASMVRSCAEIIREVRVDAFDGCDRLIAEVEVDYESIRAASAGVISNGDAA